MLRLDLRVPLTEVVKKGWGEGSFFNRVLEVRTAKGKGEHAFEPREIGSTSERQATEQNFQFHTFMGIKGHHKDRCGSAAQRHTSKADTPSGSRPIARETPNVQKINKK